MRGGREARVSRRLVRHLKGRGRLAVYLPHAVEPDRKTLRLYRAVARIAMKAEARIVPVIIDGARHLPFSLVREAEAPRHRLRRPPPPPQPDRRPAGAPRPVPADARRDARRLRAPI